MYKIKLIQKPSIPWCQLSRLCFGIDYEKYNGCFREGHHYCYSSRMFSNVSGYNKETGTEDCRNTRTLEATAAFTGIKRGLIAQGNTHTTVLGFAGTENSGYWHSISIRNVRKRRKSYTFVTTTRLI